MNQECQSLLTKNEILSLKKGDKFFTAAFMNFGWVYEATLLFNPEVSTTGQIILIYKPYGGPHFESVAMAWPLHGEVFDNRLRELTKQELFEYTVKNRFRKPIFIVDENGNLERNLLMSKSVRVDKIVFYFLPVPGTSKRLKREWPKDKFYTNVLLSV